MSKYRIGIVGATGYTGSELVRILLYHPSVEIAAITSESYQGKLFSEVHPQFQDIFEPKLISIYDLPEDLDLVFLALPHGVSMDFIADHKDAKYKIVDLSGDFRLSGKDVYEKWYQKEHKFESGFEQAVFGLPELFREKIKPAKLIANPGCFPTSATLALAPLLKNGLIDPEHIIVDSKTGVTGAGIKPRENTHFPVVNDNFIAYGLKTHRHTIEIQETLSAFSGGHCTILFTPHLLPVDRGILSTCYSKPKEKVDEEQLNKLYRDFYKDEFFVRVSNDIPHLKKVRGTNHCDVHVSYDDRTNTIITIGVIDNLVKGAAGQAIQNMNLLLGLEEKSGLQSVPIQP
ncbi:MAG: N-acetyl-gamma-glutamyl-phosphate reductase [Cyclobacteriaceae bacterium]|nr:N-acetyl-gamma-glutamyl-phosphate reductase [Cyclobacteriaceae bacterium SS2]